ncbi:acyltransferase family protein [Pseudomonas fluorescens]|uniref:acyltransferase family protein n=1 Tax=Pseudomonas fluorescens TaxID=294 RepID=UPI003D216DF1
MLNSIQFLRAFAAWIVVLHHYVQIFDNKDSNSITASLYNYGSLGVDIFFVISGFVIYTSASGKTISTRDFAIQRIARIVPAYWLYTFAASLTIILLPTVMPPLGFTPDFLLKSMFFIPAENPSGLGLYPLLTVGWTLNFEVVFYVIFALSLRFPKNILAPALLIGITLIETVLSKAGGSLAFYSAPIIYDFLLGVVISIIYKNGYHRAIHFGPAIAIILLSITAIAASDFVDHNPLRSGLPCAAIILAFISQEPLFSKTSFTSKLGDWSYSTYLAHPLIIWYALTAQQKLGLNQALTLTGICLTTVLFSFLSYKYIELPTSTILRRKLGQSSKALPTST